MEYATREHGGTGMVIEDDDWLGLGPLWAVWPFEMLVVPKRPVAQLIDLGDGRRDTLASAPIGLPDCCDSLFGVLFPYSMGWHQAPFDAADHPHWQLHVPFYPPLLSSSTVRKFMVGHEMLAETQSECIPEDAAAKLRVAIRKDVVPEGGG